MQNNSNVDLVKNLLDPANHKFAEIIEPDGPMTLINHSVQANSRQLLHSQSTDLHHLYQNDTVIDGQTAEQLERAKNFINFLVNKIQFYSNENRALVDKRKEELATIRSENSCQEQLNSMRSQLTSAESRIAEVTQEAAEWKEKYLDLCDKHEKLIDKQSREQEALDRANRELRKTNDELEVDLKRRDEDAKRLDVENKRLNHRLTSATTELEQIKNNFDSCADLKKERLRAQQKCHVISEKLEACKTKCEQSTNLLKEKSCLVDQQTKEIRDLNLSIIDLKKTAALHQVEAEKSKNRIDELERRLKDKEDLVNEYKSLYQGLRDCRENEIKHEQKTIEALVLINTRYESELARTKADLERIRYDELQRLTAKVPDLLENQVERDQLARLKKMYNVPDGDDVLDGPASVVAEAYEPLDAALAAGELSGEWSKQPNGKHHPPTNGHLVAKKKEALRNLKLQNGNTNGTAALPS